MSPYHYVQRLSSYRANGNIFDLSLNADARNAVLTEPLQKEH